MNLSTDDTARQCQNCGENLRGKYCHLCGQKARNRITVRAVVMDAWETISNVDRGFLHTVVVLFTQPGQTIQDYVSGRTRPYMNPLRYAILWATISVVLNITFGVYEGTQSEISAAFVPEEDAEEFLENQRQALRFMQPFLNFLPILLVPFTAFYFRLFTRSRLPFNFAEHMVAGFFSMGQLSLISIPFISIFLITGSASYSLWVGMVTFVVYFGFVYRHLTGLTWTKSFSISFLSISLGYLSFVLIIMLATLIIMVILGVLGFLN